MASGSLTRPKRFQDLLRIGEAAEVLEVTSETLRNWDRWGWLSPIRNPVTGYRYYKREDIEKLRRQAIAERKAKA
jgi:DNA (cytosine-5)-methyltransferase 1